jgi:predicted nucleic acid-binding protein
LDACCLINLFATGRVEDVLARLPYRFAASQFVVDHEVLALAAGVRPDGSVEREVLSPRDLEASGHLAVLDIEGAQEQAEFVRFAAELDDGEASVCALAVVHGAAVATDDRKALRLLAQPGVGVATIQTPELLFEWARLARGSNTEVAAVLRAVRDRGRFYPRRDAPRFAWWDAFFR